MRIVVGILIVGAIVYVLLLLEFVAEYVIAMMGTGEKAERRQERLRKSRRMRWFKRYGGRGSLFFPNTYGGRPPRDE